MPLRERDADALVGLFKVLGDPTRLRIVGLLAQRPHTVENIAAALRIGTSTASHHLARLTDADLIRARAEGYYNVYSLRTEVLTDLSRRLLQAATTVRPAGGEAADAFDRKVLDTFTDEDGRITAFPAQEKKFLVLVRYVLAAFEHGVRYPEKRVNQILKRYNDDTARLRRALVDHGFMRREGGGGKYWRTEQAP